MCAIVDANVADEVFGKNGTEAGKGFLKWLFKGQGRLIVGGGLRLELAKTSAGRLLQELMSAGCAIAIDDVKVDEKAEELRSQCRSDDPHVIALAQVSGARLLYSNDKTLHKDFGNLEFINEPQGKIFSTNKSARFSKRQQALLNRKDLCRM